ncbi:MAG: bifunctional phosphopantothenoylcysteine decarboxylase/phosphopantothenate--cysteine ligase CoaBC [Actinobacteria bacterium]|nr:bifunctional phosphopantothenoylcysteine decarboxylase/phosphopantothenate--cysteine ligase CoaBC [Thermoleophilia bacterium]MCB9010975.1 bifunctional phosphopantothenoylcysteine decarboxylase/phosphopantothenate--cysteine ligase CoaBC [Actinomycetota bacterium]
MAEVLLGVSGGIAAYKAVDVLRMLQRDGHDVSVIMTRNATRFVGPETFSALSGRPVGLGQFTDPGTAGYDHLDFARRADVAVVCPATANTLARLAHGLADGLLSTSLVAFDGPVVVAPAMNTRMWEHPATVANVATLEARGVVVVPPASGLLADGEVGMGRLASPADVCAAVERVVRHGGEMQGREILITAGGTREPIDAVRYVGNSSSGKMAWAIVDAARDRGARVTVVAANVDLPRRPDVTYRDAGTAEALHRVCLDEFPGCDALVMTAAVADYRPVRAETGKIDKSAASSLQIDLERTTDILSDLAAARADQVMVGFAAEAGAAGLQRARDKRTRKGVDIVVHNDISAPGIGFGSDDNAITIIGPGDAEVFFERRSKRACAEAILDALMSQVTARTG